jgi:tRNA 2-thiouridine synthesizing protein B
MIKYGKMDFVEPIKFRAAKKGDIVVLVQDGIFWALDEVDTEADIFVVIDDAKARGCSAEDLAVS